MLTPTGEIRTEHLYAANLAFLSRCVIGSPMLTTARQLKVDQLPRDPGLNRAGEEAGVGCGGLGGDPPAGSVADEFESKIRELRAANPTMPATAIGEQIGWPYSIRTLRRDDPRGDARGSDRPTRTDCTVDSPVEVTSVPLGPRSGSSVSC